MAQDPVSISSPDRRAQDLTGKSLGNYVVIRRLGRGGMANVYLAQQTTLNRPVAVKVLRPELAIDKAYVTRFHREAEAAAALIQANIVQIYEVGEVDGIHFIAQEYVRGQNLRQYLNRNTVVEPILAVSILRQVAAALQKASEHGVIHRDIKPENIMIASNGEVKVADFGLARVMDDKRTDLTQIGITMGTPLYMSPEQAEASHVDTRSDLYSLGITAWHMLTGRPPFEGETALAIAVKHVKEELAPLSSVRPDLPQKLGDIVNKLASKKPEDRYQTPAALIKQLRTLEFDDIADWDQLTEKLAVSDYSSGIGGVTLPQSRLEVTRQLETIMSGQFRPWWRAPWLGVMATLMAAVGGLAGAIYAWTNPPRDPLVVEASVEGEIPRMESAMEQYYFAYDVAGSPAVKADKEEKLWLAVKEYHPAGVDFDELDEINLLYSRKTDLRLGEFYLNHGKFVKANRVFDNLADLEETEEGLRLAGIGGKVILHEKGFDQGVDESRVETWIDILNNSDLQKVESEYLRRELRKLLNGGRPGRPPRM